jgi:hypothetical protein
VLWEERARADEQLGSRWLAVLTPDQTVAAQERGMLRELTGGNDPDAGQ